MTEQHLPQSCVQRGVAVLVGLFAVWQLVFLPAANLIVFVPLRPAGPPVESVSNTYQARGTFTRCEPLQRAAEGAKGAIGFWSEASATEQGWPMFAPGPPYTVFVAAEFRWPDGTSDTLLSRYEPRDHSNPPARALLVHNRHFHFEAQFVAPVWYAGPEALAEHAHLWADLPDTVRGLRAEIRAWLGWRLRDYRAANPHRAPPREVVMKHRYISSPKPDDPRGEPRTVSERPFARWWPETGAVDAFDVITMRFVPVQEAQP